MQTHALLSFDFIRKISNLSIGLFKGTVCICRIIGNTLLVYRNVVTYFMRTLKFDMPINQE